MTFKWRGRICKKGKLLCKSLWTCDWNKMYFERLDILLPPTGLTSGNVKLLFCKFYKKKVQKKYSLINISTSFSNFSKSLRKLILKNDENWWILISSRSKKFSATISYREWSENWNKSESTNIKLFMSKELLMSKSYHLKDTSINIV